MGYPRIGSNDRPNGKSERFHPYHSPIRLSYRQCRRIKGPSKHRDCQFAPVYAAAFQNSRSKFQVKTRLPISRISYALIMQASPRESISTPCNQV